MERHEREGKCLSFVVLESDFGRESSHLHAKEKCVSLGSLPCPSPLGKMQWK